jgi:release factor glutamine methyltransferase
LNFAILFSMATRVEFQLSRLRERLVPLSDSPSLEAQVLLAHVLEKPRAWVLAHPEAELSAVQLEALDDALRRLEAGEPLPYVLGHWEFYGLDFALTPDVLIPRPETELLVEQALAWLRRRPPAPLWAADVGTGSGCIAVSLAVHAPDLHVVATDLSRPALQTARRNALRHGVADRIHLVQSDLLSPFPLSPASRANTTSPYPLTSISSFSLLLSNLPYIPTETLAALPVASREPCLALDGGPDGLSLLRRLLEQAPSRLAPGGLLLLEIEAGQGAAALDLARQAFPGAEVRLLEDLAGRDRVVRVENQKVVRTETVPEMTATSLVELLRLLEAADIPVWLDGGWGVDALLQTQTRLHKDVDLVLQVADVSKVQEILGRRGFVFQQGTPPHSFVLANGAGLEVDIHAINFDDHGNGIYRMENGQDWIYPAEGFGGHGVVEGRDVHCLSPTTQVICHAHGYTPTAKDFRDMEFLHQRFGIELPPQLKPGAES